VRSDYSKIPYVAARKAAEGIEWQAPSSLNIDWLKYLSGGARPPLREVIALFAFGRSMIPDELSDIEANAARIIAARGLFKAAADGSVAIYGQRCEQITRPFLGMPGMRLLAPIRRVDPSEFADEKLTLDPYFGGLFLTAIAEQPELWAQPNGWKCAEVVRFCNLTVDCESLGAWFCQLSGKVRKKRGPPQRFDWEAIHMEAIRLLDLHGDFDKKNPKWNAQARLVNCLLEWCANNSQEGEPSPSVMKEHVGPWVEAWLKSKGLAGN
jgi:hypothetical protein